MNPDYASAATAACTHHWVIDVANGPMSRGVCSSCHQEREFANSLEENRWRIQPAGQRRQRGNEQPR